jgi:hypothetical protein
MWVAAAAVLATVVAAPTAGAASGAALPVPLPTTVVVTISGHGRVVGAGIDCPPTCATTLPFGTVSLEAVPAEGATFLGWAGACTGSATTCIVPPGFFMPVIARFSPVDLTVTVTGAGGWVTSSGEGSQDGIDCTTTCSKSFPAGSQISLWAIPAANASFVEWAGCSPGLDRYRCTFTMDGDTAIGAVFGPAGSDDIDPRVKVTIAKLGAGEGTITSQPHGIDCGSRCDAKFPQLVRVTFTATASTGSEFGGWTGPCSGTSATCSIVVGPTDRLSASFGPPRSDGGGSGGGGGAGGGGGGSGPVEPGQPGVAVPLAAGTPTFRVRGQGSTRRMVISVSLGRAADVRVRLMRRGRVLAQRQARGHEGRNTVVVPIRQRVTRGQCRGELVLTHGPQRQRFTSRLVLPR